VLLDLLPARERVALRPAGRRDGEEPAEVPVARAVLDQQPEGSRAGDRRLRADQRPHARAPGGGEETRRAVDAVPVAERERVVAERRGALDQVLGQRGAAQEAEGAATAELDVPGHVRLFFARRAPPVNPPGGIVSLACPPPRSLSYPSNRGGIRLRSADSSRLTASAIPPRWPVEPGDPATQRVTRSALAHAEPLLE